MIVKVQATTRAKKLERIGMYREFVISQTKSHVSIEISHALTSPHDKREKNINKYTK